MLTVVVPAVEYYDSENNMFLYADKQVLKLEHSLISLSKWEAKWHKPFLTSDKKSAEEVLDYFRCMTINENVDPSVYKRLTKENHQEINNYINASMTATTFTERPGPKSREIVTSELIYYWMVSLNIPFECQKWHLNRLLTLIKVCSIKNTPSKKVSKGELMRRNNSLNAARRQALGTRG